MDHGSTVHQRFGRQHRHDPLGHIEQVDERAPHEDERRLVLLRHEGEEPDRAEWLVPIAIPVKVVAPILIPEVLGEGAAVAEDKKVEIAAVAEENAKVAEQRPVEEGMVAKKAKTPRRKSAAAKKKEKDGAETSSVTIANGGAEAGNKEQDEQEHEAENEGSEGA